MLHNLILAEPIISDGGSVGIIVTAVIGFLGVIVANVLSRRASKDHNYVETFTANATAFQANMEAFTLRAKNAEAAVIEVREQLDDLQRQMNGVVEDRKKERADYTRMRTVVQKWFAQLQTAWTGAGSMPLPNDDDMSWLGITIEHPPKIIR